MNRLDTLNVISFSILLILIAAGTAFGQDGPDDGATLNQLFLSVYIDDAGRALINGYVDDPEAIAILDSSGYTYEDESRQLYAITGALTSKFEDNWTVRFESKGRYDEFQATFYLPAGAKVRHVDGSSGLDHLVYVANESFIADIQGYDITDPAIDIEYLLPLAQTPEAKIEAGIASGTDANAGYPHTTAAVFLFILLVAGSATLIFLMRSRSISISVKPTGLREPRGYSGHTESVPSEVIPMVSASDQSVLANSIGQSIDASCQVTPPNTDLEGVSRILETTENSGQDEMHVSGIELTSEIAAVMATLTDREQAVLKALLQRDGRMTQTEIRYETGISKSSLSGILTSMEKRKIITKKGYGRTNVIELSDRFLNPRERL